MTGTPITIAQANARIEELRRQPLPVNSEPEDLTLPVDPDIRVTSNGYWHRVELLVEEKAISWLSINDYQQRVGGQILRLGGIGGVSTDNDHRFQGYSRRVMTNAFRWMRANGFDVSQLYGISSFYPKFGFAPAFPGITATMALRDAESVSPAVYRLAEFDRDQHLAGVLELYQDNNARRTGTILRDAGWAARHGQYWNTKACWQVVLNRRGRLAGYVIYDSAYPAVTLLEVGFAAPAVFPDVLRFTAGLALARRVERIGFVLPIDHEFIEFCKPLGITLEQRYRHDGGAIVRLIDAASALRKLAPELGPRLRGKGALTLCTNLGDVSLSWSGKILTVEDGPAAGPSASLPQWALAQLIYGYRRPSALANEGVLTAPTRALAALERLFPLQAHFFYVVDEF